MSILIRGMEMPTRCGRCDMCITEADGDIDSHKACCITGAIIENLGEKMEDCPLVPVPPHGRLIDADVLLERFEKEEKAADEHGRDFSFSFKSGGENCTEWWPVQKMLMDAPTILPAEEGER